MATSKADRDTLVLLDAHAILHRAYHALPDFTAPNGEPTGALYGVVTMLLSIIEEFQPSYLAACYDLPEPTYRHDAYEGYKGTREKTDDALVRQIEASRELLGAFGVPIYEAAGFEADDVLGTIAHELAGTDGLRVVIASGDMDTLQCIDDDRVVVFTLKKGIKDTVLYDEPAVVERFGFGSDRIPDYKGLRGDSSDNIPGIRGIGEKTASTLIQQFGGLDDIYAQLAKDEAPLRAAGITPRIIGLLRDGQEEAEFSKMLATIRTDAPVSFALAKTQWREAADLQEILRLFSEYGFRGVTGRVRQLFGEVGIDTSGAADAKPAEITRAGILLWLLESERTNPTYEDIIEYGRAFLGTDTFPDTYAALQQAVREAGLWHIYTDIEEPLIAVLDRMQQHGIALDCAYLADLSTDFHATLTDIEAQIFEHAGHEFNVNSPKQLGEVLFDELGLTPKNAKKTAGGQRSTRESELVKLQGEHPIIDEILTYREYQKLLSTYIDPLPELVGEDGRLRTTFLQTGTTTGRLASRDPNLQNIPARGEHGQAIRRAFVAAKGFRLVGIDYSQIELRIAAMLSGDPNLIDIFRRGEDVHRGVALRVFGVDADDVTADMRRRAKVINFGILYGMGVTALQQNLGEGTTRAEAQEFLNAYFHTFSRLADYLEATKAFARSHGYTETMFGRRRHFPGITSSAPFIRASAERMAINAPIQGTQSDIIRIAMVRIDAHLREAGLAENVRMLLQVHDELVFEIRAEQVDAVVPQVTDLMSSVLQDQETHGVPVLVDVEVGENWRDMEKRERKAG